MKKPVITKEHGSWAVLLVPIITGISASIYFDAISILLYVITVLFLFLSYTPAKTLLVYKLKKHNLSQKITDSKYWLIIYLSVALVCGAVLLIYSNRYGLFIFTFLATIFFGLSAIISTNQKIVWNDFAAISGLTLSAPAIIYLTDGEINSQSILIYVMNLAFFGSNAFYVHLKMKINSLKGSNLSLSRLLSLSKLNLAYHAIAVAVVLWFSISYPSYLLFVAYLPMAIHAVAGSFRIAKTNFKKIGFTYLAYSILFAVLISITM